MPQPMEAKKLGWVSRILAKAFVPDWREPKKSGVRRRLGTVAVLFALVINLGLFAAKLAVGLLIGSMALIADSIDNFGDLLVGVIGLVAIRVGSIAPDPDHPYGHERAEEIAALAVATLIFLVGIQFGAESLRRLIVGDVGTVMHPVALWVAAASVILKWTISRVSLQVGSYLGNPLLTGSGWNYLLDVASSILALGALIGRMYGFYWLDPAFAVLITLLILRVSVKLFKDASHALLGRGATPDESRLIHEVACGVPGVLSCGDIELHRYGTKRRVSLTIHVPESMTLREGHELAERVQANIHGIHADWEPIVHVHPVPNTNQ